MMIVRPAKFVDIPKVTALARRMHADSVYAALAAGPGVETKFKKLCVSCIGGADRKVSCLFVAEREGRDGTPAEMVGFLAGITDHVYHVLRERYATDLFFYVVPRSPMSAANGLLRAFVAWADAIPDVIELRMATVDAVRASARLKPLYERKGFKPFGTVYRKECSR